MLKVIIGKWSLSFELLYAYTNQIHKKVVWSLIIISNKRGKKDSVLIEKLAWWRVRGCIHTQAASTDYGVARDANPTIRDDKICTLTWRKKQPNRGTAWPAWLPSKLSIFINFHFQNFLFPIKNCKSIRTTLSLDLFKELY